jgi:hypothetical protein
VTNQEAYDSVMNWIMREDASRCTLERIGSLNGFCVYYRERDENRCAIGGILPLNLAKELGSNGIGIRDLLVSELDDIQQDEQLKLSDETIMNVQRFFNGVDEQLLSDLQNLHDSSFNWDGDTFKAIDEAKALAEKYKLNSI